MPNGESILETINPNSKMMKSLISIRRFEFGFVVSNLDSLFGF